MGAARGLREQRRRRRSGGVRAEHPPCGRRRARDLPPPTAPRRRPRARPASLRADVRVLGVLTRTFDTRTCARAIDVLRGACRSVVCSPCGPWDGMTCARAAKNGHLETLQWLRSQEPQCPWDDWTCTRAATNGQLETLKCSRTRGAMCIAMSPCCSSLNAYGSFFARRPCSRRRSCGTCRLARGHCPYDPCRSMLCACLPY